MKKIMSIMTLTATMVFSMAAVNWATVPPPPVNQSLYIYDTKFDQFTTADCHNCHGTDAQLVTLHHNLIYTTTPAVSCYNASGTTPTTLATGCHVLIPAPGGGYTFQDFRTCSNCHTGQSPHHGPTSTFAVAQDCMHCHGSAIDNPTDGHYIPTYAINTDSTLGGVTPAPGGRPVPDPNNPTGTITVQGCEACHQASTAATPQIFSNANTHHGTNIGSFIQPGGIGDCNWCHDSQTTIRGCEACHGVKSLHNIQANTPNANNLGTIIPGNEDLGYGHIGNNWDCVGCHGSWTGSSANTTATAPAITGLSSSVVTAGQSVTLAINGESFSNQDAMGNTYNPVVTLTNGQGTITVTPFSVTTSEIKVLLPAMQQGVYELRVDKSGTVSNLTTLIVAPKQALKAATLSGSTLTITGAGFGTTPSAEASKLLGVFVGPVQARIVSWSDTKIVASSPVFGGGKTVTVKTLFGPVDGTIFAAAKKAK